MTLRRLYCVSILLAAAISAAGQEGETYLLSNRAFLDTFQGRTAYAELAARKDDGGLISLSQSPDSYLTGVTTESFIRTSGNVTFYGKMSWNYFQGKDMGGQILMDPEYNPVNFLESTDTTRGTKKRETYNLKGGLSYRLGRRWAVGAGIDYTSADQTKIKDPRFSSIWMDVNASAGIMFRATRKFMLGASFTFRNTLEQLRGGIYGTTDKQYFILTDKGGFFGTVAELAGDYNSISVNNSRPMYNRFYGASFQAVVGEYFSSEFRARRRTGYYGRRSSSTATFFEFSGFDLGFSGKVMVPFGASRHKAFLNAWAETISNSENKFKYITPTGQSTVVQYTGQDRIYSSSGIFTEFGYEWKYGSVFALGLSGKTRMRSSKTTLYPFWRLRSDTFAEADLWGRYTFAAGKCSITAEAHALAGMGSGVPNNDGSEIEAASTVIRSFDLYLNKQFEYDTATRAGGAFAVTCTLPAFGKVIPYVKLGDQYITLLSAPQYLEGGERNTATITLGCNF